LAVMTRSAWTNKFYSNCIVKTLEEFRPTMFKLDIPNAVVVGSSNDGIAELLLVAATTMTPNVTQNLQTTPRCWDLVK
jgi:hypothetical protein